MYLNFISEYDVWLLKSYFGELVCSYKINIIYLLFVVIN